MKTKTYKFIDDPGHAWLSVPICDIKKLNIADKISEYSFVSPARVYLEEDCDAGVFIDAAKAAGWNIQIKESGSYTNRTWQGRHWPRFTPAYLKNPFAVGARYAIAGGHVGTITKTGNRYFIDMDDGRRFRLQAANPLVGIFPIT